METIKQLYSIFIGASSVSIDSRTCGVNAIFFALSGENTNGNKYAQAVLDAGAKLAVVDDESLKGQSGMFWVDNVLVALQQLALYHRRQLGLPIIGITGSNGKTTSKELIIQVLSQKYKVVGTKGNLNNHIGVPLTLLSMDSNTEIGVVEMGANHVGEIGFLSQLCEPDYGLITNVGKAHLEGFGSFEGVKKGKGELYQYLHVNNKKLFINVDNEHLVAMSIGMSHFFEYGLTKGQVTGCVVSSNPYLNVKWSYAGVNYTVETKLIGSYNVENVLCAATIGLAFEIEANRICEAITSYEPQNNRSQLVETGRNKVVMDAYNANPSSMKVALTNFSQLNETNKVMVLGAMKEMGDDSLIEHESLVAQAATVGCDFVFFVGKEFTDIEMPNVNMKAFLNKNELLEFFKLHPIKASTILVKGSRGNQLERILPEL